MQVSSSLNPWLIHDTSIILTQVDGLQLQFSATIVYNITEKDAGITLRVVTGDNNGLITLPKIEKEMSRHTESM